MTDAIKWLQDVRKLDSDLLQALGVTHINRSDIGPAVAIPYTRNGKPYAGKFRAIEPGSAGKWRSSHGVSRGMWNEDDLKRLFDLPIVITEGELDAMSVMQAGWERAVSLPDGWTKEGDKRQCIIDCDEWLRKSPYVIAAGDADEVGAGFPRALANVLEGHEVRYATWPEGCKDANDVLRTYGEGELAKCLNAAKVVDPPGGFITGISDLPPMPDRRVLKLGKFPFDKRIAFEVGAMSVGTGVPGSGKSTFATFCAYHMARHEDIRVGMMAFETHPYRVRDQLARIHYGPPYDKLTEEARDTFEAWADKHFRIVHRTYDAGAHHLPWLRSMIYTLAVRDNCKLIFVDPWNELEHLPEPGESMTNYINFALQQIRQWAEKYDTHICVIAHPRKMQMEGNKIREPNGYDIADSAAFTNKPALGFTVHQYDVETESGDFEQYTRLSTWKVRETQLYGFEKGSERLVFDPEKMTYAGG